MGKKWNDNRKGEKLLRLFTLLMYREKKWSLVELANFLDCSKPTVLRLIDQLDGSLYASVHQEKKGRQSYYWLESTRNRPALSLNSDGIRQIAICQNFVQHLLPPEAKTALNVTLTQALASVEDDGDPLLPLLPTSSLRKGAIDYAPYQEAYQTMTKAILKKKIVTVNYQADLRSNPHSFNYAPKILIAYHETLRYSGWIVDAKNQPRFESPTVLLLHRIRGTSLTTRNAERLQELPNDEANFFGIMKDEPPFQAVIRFHPDTATYIHERQWSHDQKMTVLEDGSLDLTITTRNDIELFQWVLGFGNKALVLSPEWLKNDVKKEALEMVKSYSKE
jgi:predicted DNA-binding transcriptional regulator YafY